MVVNEVIKRSTKYRYGSNNNKDDDEATREKIFRALSGLSSMYAGLDNLYFSWGAHPLSVHARQPRMCAIKIG
jgi:hypothetical protein